MLVPSCVGKVRSVPLPPPPPEVSEDQASDARPAYPANGAESEEAHEGWVDDALDWGDRRNLLAYRWCMAWNKYAAIPVDCGPAPEGLETNP